MELHPASPVETRPNTKSVGILARSLFRQMRHEGYSPEQIIGLSTELLQLVRDDLVKSLPAQ